MVTIEPVGCPVEPTVNQVSVPTLSMFGDNLFVRPQIIVRRDECREMVAAINAAGTAARHVDLPNEGIFGNSHILMSDLNSDELAELILDWLEGE
jgi:hypothetical protein